MNKTVLPIQFFSSQPLNPPQEDPLFEADISLLNYKQFMDLIKSNSNGPLPPIKYIDAENEVSEFQNQDQFIYIQNEMERKTEKPIVFFFLKKNMKEKKIKVVISFEEKEQVVLQVQQKDLNGSQKLMGIFCEAIAHKFGRKIYQFIYEDTDGDQITSEIDVTLKRNNRTQEWEIFLSNLKEIMDQKKEMKISLKKTHPLPKKNGKKQILLKVSEKRQKWVEVAEDISFSEITDMIYDFFGKKSVELVLDTKSQYQFHATQESSWSQALRSAYNGSSFQILQYVPDHIVNIQISIKGCPLKYKLDKNQDCSLSIFLENCIFKQINKKQYICMSYRDEDNEQITIEDEEGWQIFLNECNLNNELIVKTDSANNSKKSISKKQSVRETSRQKKSNDIKAPINKVNVPEKEKVQDTLQDYLQKREKQHQVYLKQLKKEASQVRKQQQIPKKGSLQIKEEINPDQEQNVGLSKITDCPNCETQTLDEYLYRYCKKCKKFYRVRKIESVEDESEPNFMSTIRKVMNQVRQMM